MPPEQRCLTCHFWDPPNPFLLGGMDEQGYGTCALAEMEHEGPTFPVSLALAVPHGAYQADLYTQAEFGCVQWKIEPDA